jgi:murein hydrolase activator
VTPRIRRASVAALLAFASGLALSSGVSAAGAQQTIQSEILESQRRLEQIRRERTELREEMTRLRSRVRDMAAEVDNIDAQLRVSRGLVDELEQQIGHRRAQIHENEEELAGSRAELATRTRVLNGRLRQIYKRGPLPTAQALLAAESFSDLLNRYRYLQVMARHDRRLADRVRQLEVRLAARERALRSNLLQLEAALGDRSLEHAHLLALQEQRRSALAGVLQRERSAERRLEELVRDEARVREMLTSLDLLRRDEATRRPVRRDAGGAATSRPAGLVADRMGLLDWPVQGRLLYAFGPEGSEDVILSRSGIGIAAPEGALVRAVEGGTVVHAGPFDGFGPTVIVSHGEGYYTLYLFLRDVRVRENQMIQQAQSIGTVGGAVAAEAPFIEFQVRMPGGQAVDPLSWLRVR